jgi:hypothetical protein
VTTCQQFRHRLYEFLAGELPERLHAETEEHAYLCSSCAADLWTYRMTVELVRSLAPLPPPTALLLRLRLACAALDPGVAEPGPTP